MGRNEKLPSTENLNTHIGPLLRAGRNSKGISLTEIATRIGYSKSHLSAIENGLVQPSERILESYESLLGLKFPKLNEFLQSPQTEEPVLELLHLDILRRGTDTWNKWRRKNQELSPLLSNIDLSRTNLSGADLSEADLSGADLSGADLSGAILSGANLSGADLSGADLSNALLSETNLFQASLVQTNLSNANLSGANLGFAYLTHANFSGALIGHTLFGDIDMRSIKGLEFVKHLQPSSIGLNTFYLSNGNIPEIFLRGIGVPDTFIDYMPSLVHRPIEYYTCFISYSNKDELFARRLHNDLQQQGIRCWFAPENMHIGDKIRHTIDESIKLYDKLILILSEQSIQSAWVAYEVERGLAKEPKGVPNVLYPLRLDQSILTCTEGWARDLKETRHIGNFERWQDPQIYEEAFSRLLRALRASKSK